MLNEPDSPGDGVIMRTMFVRAVMIVAIGMVGLVSASMGEGVTVTRLTNVVNAYPHPSPDGSQVVYQSNRTGTAQIYVMNVDGSGGRQLTDRDRGAETPKWAPDGQTILFAAYVGEDNNDLFVMNVDGQNVKKLTDGPGYDGHPSWSADGERIIFNSDRTSPDPEAPWSQRWHEVFSIRSDGTNLKQHTHQQTICTYPGYSPDGTRIVYRKVVAGPGMSWDLSMIERNSEIFVANADGSDEVNLTSNAAFDGWPVWSPDGEWIAFSSNRAGPANVGQLFVVSPDGGVPRQVTLGPWGYAQPAWAADGKSWMAYQFEETADYEFGDVVWILEK
jgi:Tol biopolymer transport system component